jgi:hypothetical protein
MKNSRAKRERGLGNSRVGARLNGHEMHECTVTHGTTRFMMTFGHIPRNMADILIEPSSTSVECVSEFVKIMQGMVTTALAFIDQANKAAESYANKSRRDFQFGVGDAILLSTN